MRQKRGEGEGVDSHFVPGCIDHFSISPCAKPAHLQEPSITQPRAQAQPSSQLLNARTLFSLPLPHFTSLAHHLISLHYPDLPTITSARPVVVVLSACEFLIHHREPFRNHDNRLITSRSTAQLAGSCIVVSNRIASQQEAHKVHGYLPTIKSSSLIISYPLFHDRVASIRLEPAVCDGSLAIDRDNHLTAVAPPFNHALPRSRVPVFASAVVLRSPASQNESIISAASFLRSNFPAHRWSTSNYNRAEFKFLSRHSSNTSSATTTHPHPIND